MAIKKTAKAAPKKSASTPAGGGTGGSVKVLPGTNKNLADYSNAIRKNILNNQKESIKNPSILDKPKKGGTVKINSAPAKTADAAKAAADAKALKAANKPTNQTGSKMNKAERAAYNKLGPEEQKKMLKRIQNAERAGLSKTTRNTVRVSAGRGGGISAARVGGLGGGMNWQNK